MKLWKSDTSKKEVQSAKGGTKLIMIVENITGHEETFSEIEKTNLENKSDSSVNYGTSVKNKTLSKIEMKTDLHVKKERETENGEKSGEKLIN